MSKGQKILTTTLWALLVVLMVGLIASWTSMRRPPTQESVNAAMVPKDDEAQPALPKTSLASFHLTDQEGRAFSNEDLAGSVWIVDFIFTRCPGPCPLMTQRMGSLERQISDPRVKFLSFSVDSTYDTPEVLKRYAQERGANLARWHFLTGDEQVIQATAKSLLLGLSPARGDEPIMHSTRFVLLGPDGKVSNYYDSSEEQNLERLVADARNLAKELPAQARQEDRERAAP